jgi:hypothetical protein
MRLKTTPGVPKTEFSRAFIQRMIDRMCFSFFKYGKVEDAYPHKLNAIETLKLALKAYEEDGNVERMVDAANYAMIEFMRPKHPKAHWKATDSSSSFGRAWNTGHIGQDSNTHQREGNRKGSLYKREGD